MSLFIVFHITNYIMPIVNDYILFIMHTHKKRGEKEKKERQIIKIGKKMSTNWATLTAPSPSWFLSGRILMVCPLFVNVPGCVSGCRLSITALLRGSAPYGRAYGTQHHQLMLLQLRFSTSAVCLPPVVSPLLFISQGLLCFSFPPPGNRVSSWWSQIW